MVWLIERRSEIMAEKNGLFVRPLGHSYILIYSPIPSYRPNGYDYDLSNIRPIRWIRKDIILKFKKQIQTKQWLLGINPLQPNVSLNT